MEDAYRHASAQGQYPANARQIMNAARPAVLALTGDKCWKRSSYFTQELLPDFIEEHPERTARPRQRSMQGRRCEERRATRP
jgi:hypothetical protein